MIVASAKRCMKWQFSIPTAANGTVIISNDVADDDDDDEGGTGSTYPHVTTFNAAPDLHTEGPGVGVSVVKVLVQILE